MYPAGRGSPLSLMPMPPMPQVLPEQCWHLLGAWNVQKRQIFRELQKSSFLSLFLQTRFRAGIPADELLIKLSLLLLSIVITKLKIAKPINQVLFKWPERGKGMKNVATRSRKVRGQLQQACQAFFQPALRERISLSRAVGDNFFPATSKYFWV